MVQNWFLKCEEESARGYILENCTLQDAKSYRKYLRMNTNAFEVSEYFINFWKVIIRSRLKLKKCLSLAC